MRVLYVLMIVVPILIGFLKMYYDLGWSNFLSVLMVAAVVTSLVATVIAGFLGLIRECFKNEQRPQTRDDGT